MKGAPEEVTPSGDDMFCAVPAQTSEPNAVCGAKTRSGAPCQRAPLADRSRCAAHGGKSLRGAAHGRFRSGLYSKSLHRDLRAEYLRLLEHPGLLSARSDLALLRVRLNQLAGRLESGESSRRWHQVRDALDQYLAEIGDDARPSVARTRLITLITGVGDQEGAYSDLAELIERVSVIAAKENRMLVEAKLTMNAGDVRVLVASLVHAVQLYVKSPIERQQIADHLARMRVIDGAELVMSTPSPET